MIHEKFVALMFAIGATPAPEDYFVKGLVEISHDKNRGGDVIRVTGYHRTEFAEMDVSAEVLLDIIAREQSYAEKRRAINLKLAQRIIDQYQHAPFDMVLRNDTFTDPAKVLRTDTFADPSEVIIDVYVRAKDMEISVIGQPLANNGRITTLKFWLLENGEFFMRLAQGRVGRRWLRTFAFDPVEDSDRFLAEVLPLLEDDRGNGVLRKAAVQYPHPFNGEAETVTEWYEVYPYDEVARSILSFKNCKQMRMDTVRIEQRIKRDLFNTVNGLFNYHKVEEIIEVVFAFRLPDDFEPNGREFAEVSIVGCTA